MGVTVKGCLQGFVGGLVGGSVAALFVAITQHSCVSGWVDAGSREKACAPDDHVGFSHKVALLRPTALLLNSTRACSLSCLTTTPCAADDTPPLSHQRFLSPRTAR